MPFVDFAELKARVPIDQAAQLLGLDPKPNGSQFRTECPACKSGGDRAIVLTPSKGLWYCFAAKLGGDTIGLAAHILGVGQHDAALYLANQLGTEPVPVPDKETVLVSKERATVPQKPEGGKQPAPTNSFDPDAYAAKLAYTTEVQALGISEADATRLGIGFATTGFHRGSVVFAIRNPDGSIAGFAGYKDGTIKFPNRWVAPTVVPLRRQSA